MKALTTLKLTSASRSASRISRSAASTVSAVRRVSPFRDWKTSWRRVLSASNMGRPGASSPGQTLILLHLGGASRRGTRYARTAALPKPALRAVGGDSRRALRPQAGLHGIEPVTELVLLRFQIFPRMFRGRNLQRQPFEHGQPVPFDRDHLARIVAQQPHRPDAKRPQDLDADSVVALVGLEAKALV